MAKLKSRLSTIAIASDAALSLALSATANQVLQLTKIYTPVDTGWLRDSYEKHAKDQLTVTVGSAVEYSAYQEYGTYTIAAQPHLTPAMKQSEPIFKKKLLDAVKELD